MTFMALSMEKSYIIQQKTQLEYQQMVASNEYNYVTSQLTTLAAKTDVDMESAQVKKLEYYQELYDSQRNSIDSQLKVLNTELEGYNKAIENNVKTECKLSISV